MHILSIHNTYQIRGGEDESREAEEKLLREMGHHVDVYEEDNHRLNSMNPVRMAMRTVWSAEAHRRVKQALLQSQYDIVHVQNFFPLISPSIYYAAKARGVLVVQTLRNYRLLCPNALFFRDGQVCEACLGKAIPVPAIVHGCYRGSHSASLSVATMLMIHRAMQTWTQQVDGYIALTEFARQKMIAGGLPAEKIWVKPNFVHPDPGVGQGRGGYALYVGRLSEEKGLDTLLQAWQRLQGKLPLKIIGEGPLSDRVQAVAAQLPQVEWLGRMPIAQVHQLMGEAMVLIFPSKWYETFGRVAIEAFAKGTPVIASKIGAIAELVEHGHTGLCFHPGDPDDLATQVEWLLANPDALPQMRQAARSEYLMKYTATQNYSKLINIYEQIRLSSIR
ncbi:MAG TPA: glycosyltransferase family 4 protein [Allocoleopsis sp.]